MAITATVGSITFGVGDVIVVYQKVQDGEKTRLALFEGMVLGIRGRGTDRSFTVRRIGTAKIGIERIFPLFSPTIEKIEIKRHGTAGVKRAKLYYTREKSKRQIEAIYDRAENKRVSK